MSPATLRADRTVAAAPERVVAFLADLDNHFALTGRRIELLEGHGARSARVRIWGPLGLRRTAHTEVTDVRADAVEGHARVGATTRARVRWSVTPAGPGASRVELAADVLSAGALDRLLLAVGGQVWLRRCFAQALERLDRRLALARYRNR